MMKIQTKKGFTLAELLIVMAIIVVLAAVAVPTFGKQLETSRETGDMEIIRNAYTEALTFATQDGADGQLDGKFGAKGSQQSTLGAVTYAAGTASGTATYTVELAKMGNAKFSQNGTVKPGASPAAATIEGSSWTYVSNSLMDKTVPAVCAGIKKLVFTFKFDADTGEIVNAETTNLFSFTSSGA